MQQWPCSNLPTDSAITFEFDARGNLVDVVLSNGADSAEHDGTAMVALSNDAQALRIGHEVFPIGTHQLATIGADAFTAAYVEAMFFTDGSQDEDAMKDCTLSDFSLQLAAQVIKDCAIFQAAHSADIDTRHPRNAGHDFWLTRNGHGAGFWDGDWDDAIGERLTATSKAFGNVDLTKGDDGLVYAYHI
jgi:hypothetical protein